MSLYVDDLTAKYRSQETLNSLEFSVLNAQIDNYSESCIHPVLLHDLRDDQSDDKDDKDEEAIAAAEIPLLQLIVVKENPAYRGSNSSENMSIFKYAVCRLMPMAFQVRYNSLFCLLLTLSSPFSRFISDLSLPTSLTCISTPTP